MITLLKFSEDEATVQLGENGPVLKTKEVTLDLKGIPLMGFIRLDYVLEVIKKHDGHPNKFVETKND